MTKEELLTNEIIIAKLKGEPTVFVEEIEGKKVAIAIVAGIPMPTRVFFLIALHHASMNPTSSPHIDEHTMKELNKTIQDTWDALGYKTEVKMEEPQSMLAKIAKAFTHSFGKPEPGVYDRIKEAILKEANGGYSSLQYNSVDLYPQSLAIIKALKELEV